MFKGDLLPEGYLNLHLQKYQRSLFAQFRAGILPLHVETGRFRNLPLEQRLCGLCDKSEVEDEYHFLCHCAVYRDLRRKLYSTTIDLYPEFEDMDDLEKFVFLNNNLQKHVIVFITSAVLRRCTLLFHWGDLVLACALAYMYTCVWIVTYKPNGAGWWLLNYMLYLYYDITCHVYKDYVMLCYDIAHKIFCPYSVTLADFRVRKLFLKWFTDHLMGLKIITHFNNLGVCVCNIFKTHRSTVIWVKCTG